MRIASRPGFDPFFDVRYDAVVDLLADAWGSPSTALDQARSSFASVYRFWRKLGPHDDPFEWTVADAFADQRQRWAEHPADTTSPTVDHVVDVLRRHSLADAQIANIVGVDLPTRQIRSGEAPSSSGGGASGCDLAIEKRRVLALARRRTVITAVVLAGIVAVSVVLEILDAGR